MVSEDKLNILFLSSWYPSKAISTLGNFVQRHAESVATKHNVHVLYVTFLEDLTKNISIEQSIIHGVTTTIVYCRKGLSGFLSKRSAFKAGIEFLKRQGQFDFDLVHLNIIWNAGWQARMLQSKYLLPYVITEHWTGYDRTIREDQPFLLRTFSKYVVAKSSMICPVTENLSSVMQKFGLKGQYRVVPNVVDTSLFHLQEKSSSSIEFLHVSTLDQAHKNISGILRVWKTFSQQHQNVHLSIGGDGPFQQWQKTSENMGIPKESISFFGEKKWSEIAEYMQKSHCLILFSNYENLPCVIVESLASGMAVISTRVGGISEHINKDRGILISKGDEAALLKALQDFTTAIDLYMPLSLRKYAEENFSIPSVAEAYDRVYRDVLKK